MAKQTYNHKTKKKIQINKKKRFRYKFSKKISQKKSPIKIISNDTHIHKNIVDKSQLMKNVELIKNNLYKYSNELSNIHFKAYARDILSNNLNKELNENKKIINEEILYKYNLTKEHRKYAFKYLFNFIKNHNINIKCYFSTLSIFDLFLINYSEDNLNKNNCYTFFKSKITNQLSETKLIIFILCIFSISSKYFISEIINIEQLLQYENAKDEYTYEDLLSLTDDIILYTDANICDVNIYYFIELYLFDMNKKLRELTNNEKFIEYFENCSIHFSSRIIYDISILDVFDSTKALAIIIFSYEFSKFSCGENNQKLDSYFIQWRENLKSLLTNYDKKGLEKIINWLNIYVSGSSNY